MARICCVAGDEGTGAVLRHDVAPAFTPSTDTVMLSRRGGYAVGDRLTCNGIIAPTCTVALTQWRLS